MEMEEFLKEHESKELDVLALVFHDLDDELLALNASLIKQAARLKALCDYLWLDIVQNGTVELFTQSEKTPPYERERASAKQYERYSKVYNSTIKQLLDLLPEDKKEDAAAITALNDSRSVIG